MPSRLPSANSPVHLRRARPALGTLVSIDAVAECSLGHLHQAIDAAFRIVETIHALMSYQWPGSELSELNRDAFAAPRRVNSHTYQVIEKALWFARISEGAFDPCVAGRGRTSSYTAEDCNDVELLADHHVRFRRPLQLDLGGIAKGYAVDCAIRVLQDREIHQASINAGGDIRVTGVDPLGIQLRHPTQADLCASTVLLHNAALATSAASFSRRVEDDREVSALVNPRDGHAFVGNRSVSVRAPDCIGADALTKVVLFGGNGVAEHCLAIYGAEAFILDPDLQSDGLKQVAR